MEIDTDELPGTAEGKKSQPERGSDDNAAPGAPSRRGRGERGPAPIVLIR